MISHKTIDLTTITFIMSIYGLLEVYKNAGRL